MSRCLSNCYVDARIGGAFGGKMKKIFSLFLLYGGCESSEIQSVVTLLLVDVKTEEEYVLAKGTYGMGMDLKGDMKGALKNALKSIPNK